MTDTPPPPPLDALPSGATAPAEKSSHGHDVAHAARSGAVQVLTVAGQALLSVTQVLLARLFGRAVFGGYQASLAILEMLTRGGTGGADKGMLRFVAGHRARGEMDLATRALGTGLRLSLTLSTTFALLLIVFAKPLSWLTHDPALADGLRFIAPAAIFTGGTWVLMQASLAAKVTRPNFIVRGVAEPSLLLLAGLLAAVAGRSLAHLTLAHVAATAATFTLALFVVGSLFGRGEIARGLRAPMLPGFVRFSLPLGAAELLNAVLQRADIVLLTIFMGPNATGVYAASEFITRVISNTRYVFDSIAATVFSEALHLGQKARLQQNLALMTRWVATVAAPITVTVIILRLDLLALYGPDFRDGAPALCILALGHFVNASLGLCGWILVTSGRSRMILLNNIAGASINVVAGLLLIPRFGMVGTAIASLGSVALVALTGVVEVWLTEQVFPFDLSILKTLVAAAGMFAVESLLSRHLPGRAARVTLVIGGGLVAYAAALGMLGLAPEDRRLVVRLRDRVRQRFSRT
ncbi:MAG TPA: polysaccharide biosynthesis C-terminal domain-containing protein [Polyangia bacterium]